MHRLTPEWIARHAGAGQWRGTPVTGPVRAVIDSREAGPGDLFFGLRGEHDDGSRHAPAALAAGAWGAVVGAAHFDTAVAAMSDGQAVFAAGDTLVALGDLASAWRRELGATVIGVTGSTGKTTTKDMLAAMIGASRSVVATPGNLNTEIGLPLVLLGAPDGTEAIVLEMAMRGAGQIAHLTRVATPDVGCIVNVGPVHLETLGTVEAVADAKAELIDQLKPGAGAVVPAGEPLLERHLRADLRTLTFGAGGDVWLERHEDGVFEIVLPNGRARVAAALDAPHLTQNLLAAAACCELAGIPVNGELVVNFTALRGELVEVLGGVTLINDCYNANPVSLRAALERLATAGGRKIAVLGGMAELGEQSSEYHADLGRHADAAGVATLVTVGDLARAYESGFGGERLHADTPAHAAEAVRAIARPGDTVLVKGSRSVGLEQVAELLVAHGEEGAG